jgi:hypothetical protein
LLLHISSAAFRAPQLPSSPLLANSYALSPSRFLLSPFDRRLHLP